MMETSVDVLCDGMIRRNGKMILEARSTVTMVSQGGRRMVVDTSAAANREIILSALEERGLRPEDVQTIVLTHLHHDHTSNTDLFAGSDVYLHRLETIGGGYNQVQEDLEIWPGVTLVHLPGHTPGSMGVFVEGERNIVIAGDAVPTKDNYEKWMPPGHHFDADLAMKSMSKIMEFADMVVPGHGPPFEVDKDHVKTMEGR